MSTIINTNGNNRIVGNTLDNFTLSELVVLHKAFELLKEKHLALQVASVGIALAGEDFTNAICKLDSIVDNLEAE